jgi:hypothetical protein
LEIKIFLSKERKKKKTLTSEKKKNASAITEPNTCEPEEKLTRSYNEIEQIRHSQGEKSDWWRQRNRRHSLATAK